ncbi:hypothetical protein [Endozoicomonas sp. ALE010]|uniref:hypothetical protein n=1 Tax=Endozoicomonas sp. ALE010 TaxID=3403081 RepID=UPI003BB66E2D
MDRAGSCIELRSYRQAPQNNSESVVRQDDRSCGTRAFKWIVRHPFLTAVATVGLLGAVSAGIYGLTLLGAAAPVATALSARNVTAKDLATNTSTTKTPTTEASTTEASTTEASTTEAPTTGAPIFGSEDEKDLNSLCKAPNCTFYAKSAECTENRRVRPICCYTFNPYWASWNNGETVDWNYPTVTHLKCASSSSQCTNNSSLAIGAERVYKNGSGFTYNSVDELCQSKGWGKAIYRIP